MQTTDIKKSVIGAGCQSNHWKIFDHAALVVLLRLPFKLGDSSLILGWTSTQGLKIVEEKLESATFTLISLNGWTTFASSRMRILQF